MPNTVDLLYYGNPDSTLQGIIPHTVVIDDPIGCVVPSEGVRIIGHENVRRFGKSTVVNSALFNMGPERALELTHRLDGPRYPRPERKSARKIKQRLKGLRP